MCLCVRACSPLKTGLLYEFRKAFTAALSGGYSATIKIQDKRVNVSVCNSVQDLT